MKRFLELFITLALVFAIVNPVFSAENPNDSYDYRTECPSPYGGKKKADKWLFYRCECTSYAADFLNERGIKFNNYYKSVHWGNASSWPNAARLAKLKVDKTPKVGDIAIMGNHAMAIESILPGGYIKVSEYNWTPWEYSEYNLKVSDVNSVIHF